MSLGTLLLEDLRCIEEAELRLAPGLNLIQGPNGSGKTSILEAAYLLGRGRSFRTRHLERLIRYGEDSFRVYGETREPRHRVGMSCTRSGATELHIDGAGVRSRAELPRVQFVEVIDPEIHRLVEGAPAERRRWLDWVAFHVEPAFLPQWARYTRALKQRNAALRTGQDASAWNPEVAQYGEEVARLRRETFDRLTPLVSDVAQQLAGVQLSSGYRAGWREDTTLAAALQASMERDRARATTHAGPHRADVDLRIMGRSARDVLSRGQQKLVAAALVLAGIAHLRSDHDVSPTLLLDDPAAELDGDRLRLFASLVDRLDCQLLVTSLHTDSSLFGRPQAVFHVEQGRVKPV